MNAMNKEKAPKGNERTRRYVEEAYRQIEEKPDVTDILIMNRIGNPVKTSLDSNLAVQFAGLYDILLEKTQLGLKRLDPEDEVTMLRVRTKDSEVLVTPDESLTVIVVQKAQDRFYQG